MMPEDVQKEMIECGFAAHVARMRRGACPTCECEDAAATLRDEASRLEFETNGMCQECQDFCRRPENSSRNFVFRPVSQSETATAQRATTMTRPYFRFTESRDSLL